MKFKAGDMVKCINNINVEKHIILGDVYKVLAIDAIGDLLLEGVLTGSETWNHARFEKVDKYVAVKDDAGKPRFDILISVFGLDTVALIFGEGAIQYGDFNWRKSKDDPKYRMRLIAACMRHVYQYATGTKIDAKSGKPHLAHAICNLLMVLDMETE